MSPPHIATPTDAQRIAAARKQKAAEAQKLEAEQAKVRGLTTRMKQIERTIHAFITNPALTDEQRTELLGLLAGTRNGKLDPKHAHNSPAKQRLVDNYRAMTGDSMRVISMLSEQLATLGRRNGGAR